MLTITKFKLKTKHFTEGPPIRFDLEKLEDLKIADVYQAMVGGKLADFCVLDSDIDTLANSLKDVLLSTGEEVLRGQRTKIQQ